MSEKDYDTSSNSWFAWSKHVLMQLEHDAMCLSEVKKELTNIKVEIARLKVKSGIWGAIGGMLPVISAILIGLLIWYVKTK